MTAARRNTRVEGMDLRPSTGIGRVIPWRETEHPADEQGEPDAARYIFNIWEARVKQQDRSSLR